MIIDAGCPAKHLRISRPSQTLIPLRAIGGHIHKIASLPPENIGIQPVDLFISADKMSGAFEIGINCNRGKAGKINFIKRILIEPDITVDYILVGTQYQPEHQIFLHNWNTIFYIYLRFYLADIQHTRKYQAKSKQNPAQQDITLYLKPCKFH